MKRLAEIHEFGMEPDVIAQRVLDAMRENRFHIFSHPEFKDELRELFDEILQDFRDYPPDPGFERRTGFEKIRRDSYKQQRKGLQPDRAGGRAPARPARARALAAHRA